MRKPARVLALGLAALIGLFLVTLAIPFRLWRTGELPAPPLRLIDGGPLVRLSERVWIDTDAACGAGERVDPDDCFAVAMLARSRGVRLVGISTVHGNAAIEVVDRTTRELVAALNVPSSVRVHRGSGGELGDVGRTSSAPAHEALGRALNAGPLTLALGPLTNIAAALVLDMRLPTTLVPYEVASGDAHS